MIVADGESGESSEDSDLLDSLCVTRRGVSDGETDSKMSARRAYLGISIYPVPLLTRNSKNIIGVNANKRKHNLVSHNEIETYGVIVNFPRLTF